MRCATHRFVSLVISSCRFTTTNMSCREVTDGNESLPMIYYEKTSLRCR